MVYQEEEKKQQSITKGVTLYTNIKPKLLVMTSNEKYIEDIAKEQLLSDKEEQELVIKSLDTRNVVDALIYFNFIQV